MNVDFLHGFTIIFDKKNNPMKALKFYDREGVAFELYMDYEKESVMLQVEEENHPEMKRIEFDDEDLDDIIIALADLKSELMTIRNISNN